MKILDITDSNRINRNPDQRIILLSNGNSSQSGFKIKHLELRYYSNINTQKSISYSIITEKKSKYYIINFLNHSPN